MTLSDICDGFWKFNGDMLDATPNNQDGTLSVGTLESMVVTGKINQALRFNGTQRITLPTADGSFNPSTNTWGVSLWVRFQTVPDVISSVFFGTGNADVSELQTWNLRFTKILSFVNQFSFSWYMGTSGPYVVSISLASPPTPGNWYHFWAGRSSDGRGFLMVNNTNYTKSTIGDNFDISVWDNIRCGNITDAGGALVGSLDEICLFKGDMPSNAEVAQLAAGNFSSSYPFEEANVDTNLDHICTDVFVQSKRTAVERQTMETIIKTDSKNTLIDTVSKNTEATFASYRTQADVGDCDS